MSFVTGFCRVTVADTVSESMAGNKKGTPVETVIIQETI